MLRIGQKVTQTKPFKWRSNLGEVLPEFGVVYTIRAIKTSGSQAFLLFYEIKNAAHSYADFAGEMDFAARWFRPVVDRPTDITIFTEILDKTKIPEMV